jgi:hypothetical protein
MAGPAPPPVFIFRGHKVGVTALVCHHTSTLYSGDEEGNIISWDLTTFKRLASYNNVCASKILSLKIIRLILDKTADSEILVIQTRNDGVHLNALDTLANTTQFPTYECLFSRGDAITLQHCQQAVLAYPSAIESHLVTVRYLGNDAKTLVSGSARRQDEDQKRREATIFDIKIQCLGATGNDEELFLFTAYEDGCVVMYSFDRSRVETVPELNVTGLKIELLRKFDFCISDFVSAFDVIRERYDSYTIICGSPKKELIFSTYSQTMEKTDEDIRTVVLNKTGTSAISIRPDQKLVVVGGWDNNIRVFSIKSSRHLATLKNHTKQVSNITFGEKNSNEGEYLMCCASLDGTISIYDIFNKLQANSGQTQITRT